MGPDAHRLCHLQRKFEKNQQDMKEQVLKFEKFIQENDAKRHRAELKIKHERKYVNGTASHDDGPCQHEDVAADVSVMRTGCSISRRRSISSSWSCRS